jgi:hypothetical protein
MRNPALRLSEDAVDAEFFFWGTRLDDYLGDGQNFGRHRFGSSARADDYSGKLVEKQSLVQLGFSAFSAYSQRPLRPVSARRSKRTTQRRETQRARGERREIRLK